MIDLHQARIKAIRNAPFSLKEKDILTGAEMYVIGVMELSLIPNISQCFAHVQQDVHEKIECIWRYTLVAFHLRKDIDLALRLRKSQTLKIKAARIYELESQRILGNLFSLEDEFWKIFYKRQETEIDKILIALDALYFTPNYRNPIVYQLLIQAFRAILIGYYSEGKIRRTHWNNAQRLIKNLPVPTLKSWITKQIIIS